MGRLGGEEKEEKVESGGRGTDETFIYTTNHVYPISPKCNRCKRLVCMLFNGKVDHQAVMAIDGDRQHREQTTGSNVEEGSNIGGTYPHQKKRTNQ